MPNKLLFIEANTSGTGMLALRKAIALGLRPVFFTNDPQRYDGLEEIDCQISVCDTNRLEVLQVAIEECVSRVEIGGIMTTSDFYLETVSTLAARYGLPGNPPEAMRKARNKMLTRQILEQEAIPQPHFALARSTADVGDILKKLGLPCVVKPVDDSGSNNVVFCQTKEQVEGQIAKIQAVHQNVRGQQTSDFVLVEEYLEAPEFSVEMFTWQGKTTCVGITQKILAGFPYFVEARHLFPASLSDEQFQQVTNTVQQALTLLGILHGATHTEVKWTPQGCFIIEVNARLAGGMIPELIRLVTGVDLLEQQIKSTVGRPISLQGRFQGVAGIQFLSAKKPGKLYGIEGLEKVATMRDVISVKAIAKAGIYVQPPQNGYHRLGYVIVQSINAETATARLQEAVDQVRIHID
jgi:biotin carboxylase